MFQLTLQYSRNNYRNLRTCKAVHPMPRQPQRSALLIAASCALVWLTPQPVACQQRPIRTPSAECSKAADAKELGAAARQRFLESCGSETSSNPDLDPGSLPSESDRERKLSPQEEARLKYCLEVSAGRSLSGLTRERFLSDCLKPQKVAS